jgi:hypothetical protein
MAGGEPPRVSLETLNFSALGASFFLWEKDARRAG